MLLDTRFRHAMSKLRTHELVEHAATRSLPGVCFRVVSLDRTPDKGTKVKPASSLSNYAINRVLPVFVALPFQ
jgi:hypothetical protein